MIKGLEHMEESKMKEEKRDPTGVYSSGLFLYSNKESRRLFWG